MFYQKNDFLANSKDADQANSEFLENMRAAMEDLLGRTLGVSDYRFILRLPGKIWTQIDYRLRVSQLTLS
jgi:hypothetical protein